MLRARVARGAVCTWGVVFLFCGWGCGKKEPPVPQPAPTVEPRPAEPTSEKPGDEEKADVAPARPEELSLDLGNGAAMNLVLIPAGEFMMGSPAGEDSWYENEQPQHRVEIAEPFFLGVTEVTQEQYEAVMETNPSEFQGAKNPVEQVSWDDAREFCEKLGEKTGRTVRLPTEAEWEYACRAGGTTAYGFGDSDDLLGEYAWCADNSEDRPHEVAQKKPNAWGPYDMHGNVWEWCQDWYGDYGSAAATDPTGPAGGAERVLRGGSWGDAVGPRYFRSAYRLHYGPAYANNMGGFRVVVERE